jgi:3-oxoacyl-[acyl-carrier-protein] synthase II
MAIADELVITGSGAISPLGGDAPSTMRALLAGTSGIRLLPEPQRRATPVYLHAPVQDAWLTRVSRVELKRFDRSVHLGLQAAREAWQDAKAPQVDGTRLAVLVATGIGGLQTIYAERDRYLKNGYHGVPAHSVPALMVNATSALIAAELGAHAGAISLGSACASGASAVAHAQYLFMDDDIDVAIVGGTEAIIDPLTLSAFAALRALSTRHENPATASRPFDRDRDGFVLGEGAAALVIERRRHAVARGARIWGRLLGTGSTCDGSHIVAPEASGRWCAEAIRRALRRSGLLPSDVTFISAHATATVAGDLAEWRAFQTAFGPALPDVCVTAVKSGIGHLMGASGSMAMALATMSLRENLVPPTQNLDRLDPSVELDVVRGAPRSIANGCSLINSSGFGGQNVAVVVGSD